MKCLSRESQDDINGAFVSTLRYLDDLSNIDNICFDQMVDRIYLAYTLLHLHKHFIRFGTKLHRQNVCIPIGTNCAPLVADLFLVCYEVSLKGKSG